MALASVLALRPAYLILDEPTSQLDPEGATLVGAAIQRAAERTGAGVLLVEHRTDLIERLCHRAALLVEGALRIVGPATEVLAESDLDEAGVGPPSAVRLRRAIEGAGIAWRAEWRA